MSRTKNASRTGVYDFFMTPPFAVRALAPVLGDLAAQAILDPGAGTGNICGTLMSMGADRRLVAAVDIREECQEPLARYADTVVIQDFLTLTPAPMADLIVMNPPFKTFDGRDGVRAFVEHAFGFLKPDGRIFCLARFDWIAPAGRDGSRLRWNRAHPADAYLITRRPAFLRKAVCKTCDENIIGGLDTLMAPHPAVWPLSGETSTCAEVGNIYKLRKQSDTNAYAWWSFCNERTESGRIFWLECDKGE